MSPSNFSLLEAVELAINMEEEGIRFYTLAAGRTDEKEMKDLFDLLRNKEYDHLNIFRRFYAEMAEKAGQPEASLYLIDPEVEAYFHDFVESTVFPVKGAADAAIAGVGNTLDILRLGMQAEKDSILYYHELRHHAAYPGADEALARIIGEERTHLRALHALWKAKSGPGNCS